MKTKTQPASEQLVNYPEQLEDYNKYRSLSTEERHWFHKQLTELWTAHVRCEAETRTRYTQALTQWRKAKKQLQGTFLLLAAVENLAVAPMQNEPEQAA